MLEHIFRNLNDIRVFDVFHCEYCDGEEIDVDGILEILEYPYRDYIQIEDSVEHLVKQHILEKVYNKVEGWNGCRICSYTDRLKLPRIGKHKKHKTYEKIETEFPYYRIALNDFTTYLFRALFEYMKLQCDDIEEENKNEQTKIPTNKTCHSNRTS